MRTTLVAALLALAAGAAWSQVRGTQYISYQNALLARPVPADVKAYCTAKGSSAGAAYDSCRVTRLFLSDLAAKRDQGFPPAADIMYTSTQAEQDSLVAALAKYSN